jgi:MFS family permease
VFGPLGKNAIGARIFALLCTNAVILYIDRTNLSIAAPLIAHDLGLNNVSLGLVFSAFSISYASFMILGGRTGDHIGPRNGLVICGLVWAAGTILTGMVGGLVGLVLARLLVGIGESPFYPIASAILVRWIRADQRGAAQGVLHGFGRLGAAITPAAVTVLIVATSWRWAFILLGLVSIVITSVVFLYVRDDPRLHPSVSREELARLGHDADRIDRAAATRRTPMPWMKFFARIWPVTTVCFCYGWFSWFLLNWVPLYFAHAHGMDIRKVAMFATSVLVFGFLGNIAGGLIADWWLRRTGSLLRSRRDTILLGFIGALLCIVPLLITPDLAIDTIALALGCFCIELADAPMWMLGMDALPSHAATSTATVNTGFALSGAVSPIVVGWLLDVTQSWNMVFMVAIAVLLLGPLAAFRIRIYATDESEAHGLLTSPAKI